MQTMEHLDGSTVTSGAAGPVAPGPMDWALRALFAAAALVFVAAVVGVVRGGQQLKVPMRFDGPVFDSVEDLSGAADVVVEVQVKGLERRLIDHGGEEPLATDPADGEALRAAGLPTALYEVQVRESLAGDLGRGEKILVALLDDQVVESEHVVALERGSRYLLFMVKVGAEDVAGFDTGGRDLYLPLNYSNGVLAASDSSIELNWWTLGVDASEAELMVDELAEIEASLGREEAEARRALRAQHRIDRRVVIDAVESSR